MSTLTPLKDVDLYPDQAFLESLNLSNYESDFLKLEYGRGLHYYLNRLDRILFRGERVLDAGCGVGQWSLALSKRFRQVDAIDVNRNRLETFKRIVEQVDINNIVIEEASITALPFLDNTFDAIFCYGVIMFTPIEQSLKEFHRVLKPGGRVYICLNGEGWFQMLLDTRQDESLRKYMRHILAKTIWERCGSNVADVRLRYLVINAYHDLAVIMLKSGKDFWRWYAKLPYADSFLASRICRKKNISLFLQPYIDHIGPIGYRHFAGYLMQQILIFGRSSFDRLFCRCVQVFHLLPHLISEEHLHGLLHDIDDERLEDPTRGYKPEEVGFVLDKVGFTGYQHAWENGLICDSSIPSLEAIYPGVYKGELSVWEAIFDKPGIDPSLMSPNDHYQAAINIREQHHYITETPGPVSSNRSKNTYPSAMLEIAKQKANVVGGEAHLQCLIESLCQGLVSKEDRFRMILQFVQKSLFRDPVSQPLLANGAIPEDATLILMTHLGRCGHVAQLLSTMLNMAEIRAEKIQLPRHVSVKAWLDDQWVLAEADIFKNGIFPSNRQGKLLNMEDIRENPYRLDCFPPTGWCLFPNNDWNTDYWRRPVHGYVDVLYPDDRGFVSGFFDPSAIGYPPSLPLITGFFADQGEFMLEWSPSRAKENDLVGYRISVGTQSRNWNYNELGRGDEILHHTADNVFSSQTSQCKITGNVPKGADILYASVTAISKRIEKEPETFFWPSEEKSYVIGLAN